MERVNNTHGSAFCLESAGHTASLCREKDTPVGLYSLLIYVQKKHPSETWENRDVLKALPLTGGKEPARLRASAMGERETADKSLL